MRLLATAFLFICHLWAQPKGTVLNVQNVYSPLNANRYAWTIWVAEPEVTLQQIKCVEYTLHPTFPNPIRTQCDQRRAFSLSTAGWGEFRISMRFLWKDGHETSQSHDLDLSSQDHRVSGNIHLDFPVLEVRRLSPNRAVFLEWPGFGGRVAVSIGPVTLRSNGLLGPFSIYCYAAPSRLSTDAANALTIRTIRKLGQRTTITQLPGQAVLAFDHNQYVIEAVETDNKRSITVAVR